MPDRSDHETVHTYYRDRLTELGQQRHTAEATRTRMRLAFAFCAAVACLLVQYHAVPWWSALIPAAAVIGLIPFYLRLQTRLARILRLLVFHDFNLERVDGSQPQSSLTGEEFRDPAHLYDRDLNILGTNSIFGLLGTVRTGIGQRGLARFLLDPASNADALERQQAVQELTPRTSLREEIALLGTSRFEQLSVSKLDTWLDEPSPVFHPAIRILLVLTSAALIALLLAGILHYIPWATLLPNLAAVFALHTAIAALVRSRVVPILKDSKIASQMQTLSDGLALLQKQSFTSPRLIALQQASRAPTDAIAAMSRIQSNFVIVEQRTKEWFFVLSLLLAAGTHAAIAIANWKRTHAQPMKTWLASFAEFEALNALANYAFEHPENIYPEILLDNTPATFEATALRHPLLPNCIPNDVALNSDTHFYLISGSNMSGKSTLLRTIGTSTVLALAGAPIRATSARISPARLCTSIALTDSLAEAKSKFLAEVERLHAILAVASPVAPPVLFLIDEIFSGTNSSDRLAAAEAVMRALAAANTVGALSTHDLALTRIATPELRGLNVHMASPDPADSLAFDYILKPGINTSSSALAILRLIGIPG
ncbi:MAG: hypothetical protein M3O31_01915 [Acidobacteriota bacterium]|nr:hypothetical protein [Acidobacteriota bacterium]